MLAPDPRAAPIDGVSHGPEGDQVASAARWLAEHWHVAPQPLTRTLREMFGLGFGDSCKAIAEARRLAGQELRV